MGIIDGISRLVLGRNELQICLKSASFCILHQSEFHLYLQHEYPWLEIEYGQYLLENTKHCCEFLAAGWSLVAVKYCGNKLRIVCQFIACLSIDNVSLSAEYTEMLGKGAYKTVYRAFDEVDGIEVAWNQVKVDEDLQNPSDLERLYSEVELLKSVKHQNIIKFYSSWIDDQNTTVNIITEIFTSGTLRQYRKKHKQVDMKAVKRWARQILCGLLYLHGHDPPIIHRDLKCDNIFVNGNHGEVKIGDLGLATVMRQAHAHSVIGTPEFMAPELYEADYDELVDIYSFGMCLLEMVTFEYPYSECANTAQIYKKVTSGIKPTALNKIKNVQVRSFIDKCLAPAPNRLSARELLMDPFLQCEGVEKPSKCFSQSCHAMPQVGDMKVSCSQMDERDCTQLELLCKSCNLPPSSVMSHVHNIDECHTQLEVQVADVQILKDGSTDLCSSSELEIPEERVSLSIPNLEVNSSVASSSISLPLPSLEAQGSMNKKEYEAIGSKRDDNTISLRFRISNMDDLVRNIHFHFYIDSDTSFAVANEMVEQLDLPDKDAKLIAETIDHEIVKLLPCWKPAFSVGEAVDINEDSTNCFYDDTLCIEDGQGKTECVIDKVPSSNASQGIMLGADDSMQQIQTLSPEYISVEESSSLDFEGTTFGRFEEFNCRGLDHSSSFLSEHAEIVGEYAFQVPLASNTLIEWYDDRQSLCSEGGKVPSDTCLHFGFNEAAETNIVVSSDGIVCSGNYNLSTEAFNQDMNTDNHTVFIDKEKLAQLGASLVGFDDRLYGSKDLSDNNSSSTWADEIECEELQTQLKLLELQYQHKVQVLNLHYQLELQEINRKHLSVVAETKKMWQQKRKKEVASSEALLKMQIDCHLPDMGYLESMVEPEALIKDYPKAFEDTGKISLKEHASVMGNVHDNVSLVLDVVTKSTLSASENPQLNLKTLKESLEIASPVEISESLTGCQELTSSAHTTSDTIPYGLELCTDASIERNDFAGDDFGDLLTSTNGNAEPMNLTADIVDNGFEDEEQSQEVYRHNLCSVKYVCHPRDVSSKGNCENHEGTRKDASCTSQEIPSRESTVYPGSVVVLEADSQQSDTYFGKHRLKNSTFSDAGATGTSVPANRKKSSTDMRCPPERGPLFSSFHGQQTDKPSTKKSSVSYIDTADILPRASHAEDLCKGRIEKNKPTCIGRAERLNAITNGPEVGHNSKLSVDPTVEQQRKEQLQKSIAALEAMTLEGLCNTRNGYLSFLTPKKTAAKDSVSGGFQTFK
eukprot:Gb_06486 [translate_table: standard]